MSTSNIFLGLVLLGMAFYFLGRWRALNAATISGQSTKLHSLPSFHGSFAAMCMLVPVLLVGIFFLSYSGRAIDAQLLKNAPQEIQQAEKIKQQTYIYQIIVQSGKADQIDDPVIAKQVEQFNSLTQKHRVVRFLLIMLAGIAGGLWGLYKIKPEFRARNEVEKGVKRFLLLCSIIAVLTTIGIVFSVLFESIRFFQMVPLTDFLFGTQWSPQIAIREDQVGSSGAFGVIPLVSGTLLIAAIAMLVAAPIGLMSAIYLSEYATNKVRSYAKPMLEILAGIPTVVYGFFAALTVAPFLRNWGESIGLSVSSESALAAGAV
ncbi:MAG: phosphate ABC transporter permease family protein, partial [Gammaproteobacteria bacterium]|nr:phosphate ABC transporter permease family protein [Gammaproteobacteria bacterium]